MASIEERVTRVEATMEAVRADVAELKGLLGTVRDELQQGFRAMDDRLDRRFAAMDDRLDHGFEAVDRRLRWVVGLQMAVILAILAGLFTLVAKLI